MQNSEFAYFSSKRSLGVNAWNKCLIHHLGGMLAWKNGLRFWVRALAVPFSGIWKIDNFLTFRNTLLYIGVWMQVDGLQSAVCCLWQVQYVAWMWGRGCLWQVGSTSWLLSQYSPPAQSSCTRLRHLFENRPKECQNIWPYTIHLKSERPCRPVFDNFYNFLPKVRMSSLHCVSTVERTLSTLY